MKTITNFLLFVIFAVLIAGFTGCSASNSGSANTDTSQTFQSYDKPIVVGKITSRDIRESSGIAVSQCQDNVLWTHNDSGDGAYIYALDTKGKQLGVWRVEGATNTDWEDLALTKDNNGKCFIYIGEIGNNRLGRKTAAIYRINEPDASSGASSTKRDPRFTERAEKLTIMYPDAHQNAEALLVHPQSGAVYVIAKLVFGAAGVYKLKPDFGNAEPQTAVKVGEVSLPALPNGLVTAGDISPDGKRVVIADYFSGYEIILPESAEDFDEIWKVLPVRVDIGKREIGEAVAYSPDGNAIFSTSEKANSPIYKTERQTK